MRNSLRPSDVLEKNQTGMHHWLSFFVPTGSGKIWKLNTSNYSLRSKEPENCTHLRLEQRRSCKVTTGPIKSSSSKSLGGSIWVIRTCDTCKFYLVHPYLIPKDTPGRNSFEWFEWFLRNRWWRWRVCQSFFFSPSYLGYTQRRQDTTRVRAASTQSNTTNAELHHTDKERRQRNANNPSQTFFSHSSLHWLCCFGKEPALRIVGRKRNKPKKQPSNAIEAKVGTDDWCSSLP
jgi:hypothetical protein